MENEWSTWSNAEQTGMWQATVDYVPDTGGDELEPRFDSERSSDFVSAVAKAVNSEYNSVRKYRRLAELAPNDDFRSIIEDIRKDEKRHYRCYCALYASLTGGQKPVVQKDPLPSSFKAGVDDAVRGELEDAANYQCLAELTHELHLSRMFMDNSHDEQRHATWFLYMLQKV